MYSLCVITGRVLRDWVHAWLTDSTALLLCKGGRGSCRQETCACGTEPDANKALLRTAAGAAHGPEARGLRLVLPPALAPRSSDSMSNASDVRQNLGVEE